MITQEPTPKLRFQEFKEHWAPLVFGKFLSSRVEYSDLNAGFDLFSLTLESGVTPKTERYNRTHLVKSDESAYKVVYPGDFVYNPMNVRFGAVSQYNGEKKVIVSKYYDVFSVSNSLDSRFLAEYLKTHKTLGFYNRVATGALDEKKRVHFSDFIRFERLFPAKAEQKKIADFTSSVDKKISLLKEKHALLAQYKKGVVQKLFKQEIRFKDDSGSDFPSWQSLGFGEVFERITRKNKEDNQNVLTISAQMGLVNQEKYFNKSVSAKDLTGYYLLENGDFAYNKSYSKGYPMGAIKRLNNYDKGVVSTLYICFRVVGEQEPLFWEQFFEAGQLNREINKIAQEGARNHGLLNVSVTEFFNDIEVPVPSRAEQRKISDFLRVLDKKLNSVKEQIELTQTFKKGLLQQMFV